jgi:hypothetical protein
MSEWIVSFRKKYTGFDSETADFNAVLNVLSSITMSLYLLMSGSRMMAP